MTNIPLIERFVAAWNRLDMDEIESRGFCEVARC